MPRLWNMPTTGDVCIFTVTSQCAGWLNPAVQAFYYKPTVTLPQGFDPIDLSNAFLDYVGYSTNEMHGSDFTWGDCRIQWRSGSTLYLNGTSESSPVYPNLGPGFSTPPQGHACFIRRTAVPFVTGRIMIPAIRFDWLANDGSFDPAMTLGFPGMVTVLKANVVLLGMTFQPCVYSPTYDALFPCTDAFALPMGRSLYRRTFFAGHAWNEPRYPASPPSPW